MSTQIVGFRVDKQYLKKIEQLSKKLKLDFSKTVRLSVDKMLEKYLGTEEEILLVDNEQWNKMVGVKLEGFLGKISQFRETLEALTPVVKGRKVQEGKIEISTDDFRGFLKTCMNEVMQDYDSFSTEDTDPTKKMIREAVRNAIGRVKGKIY